MPRTPLKQPGFLPMSRAEMERLGWQELDVLIVTGDAYVDHPSFGAALLGRWLAANGYRAGVVAQPRWDSERDLTVMGRPRLFVGVTAGALDSMLAHYTAFRKKRSEDAYTPGGKAGARPNRACLVYANLARRAFPGLPVVLGGVEASLRRASHYDFWSDALKRSILLDAKATAVLCGMAEHSVLALAEGLDRLAEEGGDLTDLLASLPGAAYAIRPDRLDGALEIFRERRSEPTQAPAGDGQPLPVLELPSHEDILQDPARLIEATSLLERQAHQDRQVAVQLSGDRLVVFTPPGGGLEGEALDALYALAFTRRAHPSYALPVPAQAMIEGSLNIHRGCAGGCSFCTLALHQGRRIRSRSRASVLDEAGRLAGLPGFRGSISDVGGPSANMWGAFCAGDMASCARASCLTPRPCRHFRSAQKDFVDLLEDVAAVPGVKHVRVASGWRMDLGLADKASLRRLVRRFTGGQAKVAPEHLSPGVLRLMRKPGFQVFEEFLEFFARQSGLAGKEQYVVPYFMSAHPGCTEQDMRDLSRWLAGRGWKPGQVQCFIPLPGAMAAAMFFAGTDPEGRPIPVARSDAERLRQHALLTGGAEPGHERRAGTRGPASGARQANRGSKRTAPEKNTGGEDAARPAKGRPRPGGKGGKGRGGAR